jgi:diguanylate cyclase (GGDEF)-like protein
VSRPLLRACRHTGPHLPGTTAARGYARPTADDRADVVDALPVSLPDSLRAGIERALDAWWAEGDGAPSEPERALATTIAEGGLRVAYQPIVDLADGRTVAVEALVRIPAPTHPVLGDASQIVAVAERSGLVVALGTSVLAQSLHQLAAWRRIVADLQVHVNVSPIELRDPTYPARVGALLAELGLPNDALVLEVTETAALERDTEAPHALVTLASMGIEIALDDFGTGFSSLDLLAVTPARTLKLDRTFVAALDERTDLVRGRAMIVQAAIGMGRSLGLEIVGEGIESPTQARTLLSWGCQFGQGYLYGRPVPPERLDLRSAQRPGTPGALTIQRQRTLSPAAVDLGIALATVLAATDPDHGAVRADAMTVATVVTSALGSDRTRADAAALLAGLVDAHGHLGRLGLDADERAGPVGELLGALEVAPIIGRDTTAGAIARTAWALASRRAAGDARPDPALLAAHPDPTVDAELRERVDRWWDSPGSDDPHEALLVLERRLRSRGDADQRLRSLAGLARAIGSAGDLEDVLEITAEEVRRVLGAASVVISRWLDAGASMQVLVKVGELADWEERRPVDEIVALADIPVLGNRVANRSIHFEVLGDPTGDPVEQEMLVRTDKGSSASVPVIVDGELWGSMLATTAVGSPPFSLTDAPFLSAVSSFVGVATARATDVARLARLVNEDPLTGLRNRLRLEELADDVVAHRRGPATLVMLNIRGLKEINDEFGHAAGDRMLVEVADVLRRAEAAEADAIAARLSGDEFCLLVPASVARTRRLVESALDELAAGHPPQPRLAVGIVDAREGKHSLEELLARANAAQFRAKVSGRDLLVDDGAIEADPEPDSLDRRRRRRGRPEHLRPDGYLETWGAMLESDDLLPARLGAFADAVLTLLDLSRWVLGHVEPGSDRLEIVKAHVRRARAGYPAESPELLRSHDLADTPRGRAALERGEDVLARPGDLDADPAERTLLLRHGLTAALALPFEDPDGSHWLLVLAFDGASTPPEAGLPLVDALLRRTFGRSLSFTRARDARG